MLRTCEGGAECLLLSVHNSDTRVIHARLRWLLSHDYVGYYYYYSCVESHHTPAVRPPQLGSLPLGRCFASRAQCLQCEVDPKIMCPRL